MFVKWLIKEKGITEKSARDINCRLGRVLRIIDTSKLPKEEVAISKLETSPDYADMTLSIKSQLKRSIRLYSEFKKSR